MSEERGAMATGNNGIRKRHFQTFDALRFFAFFKVFLLHLPIVAFPWFNYVRSGGGIGVMFFFVLSGFLITYIICEEKQQTGSLNLRNFFVRRILRIWPLYYLMILVAYTTPYILDYLGISSSAEGYDPNIWMSVLFLENYQMMVTHSHANVSPLSVMWSLCIEEHFYIIWGLLLYYIDVKALPKYLIAFILLGVLSRYIYVQNNIPTSDILTNIDLFAFGGMAAYLLVSKEKELEEWIGRVSNASKFVFISVMLGVVFICGQYKEDKNYIVSTTLLGLLFACLLLLVITRNSRFKISDNNILSRLGVYTYGLYMYHTLIINLLRQIFIEKEMYLDKPLHAIVFALLSILLTIACSILSYMLFERYFLKLKRFFR